MKDVIALLDKPSSSSFGIVPFVVRENGRFHASGLSDESSHRGRYLDASLIDQLESGGHLLRIDEVCLSGQVTLTDVALWFGSQFVSTSKTVGVPIPPMPLRHYDAPGGTFAIGSASDMFIYLDRWIAKAFRRISEAPSDGPASAIAGLMQWTLPDHPKTLAARWRTSSNQNQELERQIRYLDSDTTAPALRASHIAMFDSVRIPPSFKVVAFTGGSGTKRGEVAQYFAQQIELLTSTQTAFRTFKDTILKRISVEGEVSINKSLMMKRGQEEVEKAPLSLVISTLRLGEAESSFVVLDSVRHAIVFEVLKWLELGELTLLASNASLATRRRRAAEELIDFDTLFEDPTEREVPQLLENAAQVFVTDGPLDFKPAVESYARALVAK